MKPAQLKLIAAGALLASATFAKAGDYADARAAIVAAYQAEDYAAMRVAAGKSLEARPEYPGALFNKAFSEALDNAVRHGHQMVECCTIVVRLILDPKRLTISVRDSGPGFDYAAVLNAVKGRVKRGAELTPALAKAAAALKTRRKLPPQILARSSSVYPRARSAPVRLWSVFGSSMPSG